MKKKVLVSRKRRKNHLDIHISCKNRKKREIVEKEVRKAIRNIQHLTDNEISYTIINDDHFA